MLCEQTERMGIDEKAPRRGYIRDLYNCAYLLGWRLAIENASSQTGWDNIFLCYNISLHDYRNKRLWTRI